MMYFTVRGERLSATMPRVHARAARGRDDVRAAWLPAGLVGVVEARRGVLESAQDASFSPRISSRETQQKSTV